MSQLSKNELKAENQSQFPNNNIGAITPSHLRAFNVDFIDSTVNQTTFNAYSASVEAQIAALDPSGSAESIIALNAFTASQLTINSGVNSFTQSADGRLDALEAATSSYATSAITASSLITASFDNGTRNLTFTKGDSSTFNVNIPDVSGSSGNFVTTSSFNEFTQSIDSRVDSLEAATSSYAISSSVAAVDAAQQAQIDSLIAATGSYANSASVAAVDAAQQAQIDALIAFTGSVTASIDTGSFATTGSNTFVGIQNFTNEITASNKVLINGDLTVNPTTSTKLNGNTDVGAFLYVNSGITLGSTGAAITWLGSGSIDGNFSSSVATQFAAISPTSTGSLLVTASAAGATITFTKGDGSTFDVSVATGSVASASFAETASLAINAKDIVVDVKNTTGAQINKGTVVRIIGAIGDNPLIQTASWENDASSANTLGFVVTDIPNDAFGRVMTQGTLLSVNTDPALGYTAGQLVYLSSSGQFTNVAPPAPYHEVRLGQVLRAQQNNGSIYVLVQNGYELSELHDVDITTPVGNKDLLAYNQATGQWENEAIIALGLATTGSNVFNGGQTISGSVAVQNDINAVGYISASVFQGPLATLDNLTTIVGANLNGTTNHISGGIVTITGQSSDGKVFMLGHSGSLVLSNSTGTPTYAALAHISSSQPNANTNLIFKTNNNTGTTQLSGSANIFVNPAAPSAGYVRYIGGTNNLFLNGQGGNLPQITGSAASVSGNRPTMNSNFIVGPQVWNINQSVNPGTHTYSHNIINGTATMNFNMLGNTGNVTFGQNILSTPTFTINSPSRSIAEVNAGASGSNALTMTSNLALAGQIQYQGPVSSSTHTISNNTIQGGLFASLQSGSRQYTISANSINGTLNIDDNTVFAPTLGALHNYTNNIINGLATISNQASSSISVINNNLNGITITNRLDASAVTATNQRNFSVAGSAIFGAQNSILASGSMGAVGVGRQFAQNLIAGAFISASLIGDGTSNNMGGVSILGVGLNVTGSSTFTTLGVAPTNIGSTFIGRYNSEDGNRAKTAETIFAVGTGVSGSFRKTGFLIDSGSNTFVEGTLNVSGSTSLTGSLTMTGSLNVTGSYNVNSSSYNGQAITNITPVSSSLSPILNIVTMTTAEYALITPNSQTLYVIV